MAFGDGIIAALVLVVDKNTIRLNGVDYVKERKCVIFDSGLLHDRYMCSECHEVFDSVPKYCPNCGAKVVE